MPPPAPRSSHGSRAGGCLGGRAARRSRLSRPRAGRRGAGSYQRGQLAACPCASAPAQFNGHCPPAPLFRRRPLPAGLGWGRRAETLRRGPDAEAAPAWGQRRRPLPWGARGWASEPEQGAKLGSALSSGCSFSVCSFSEEATVEVLESRWAAEGPQAEGCPSPPALCP